MELHGIPGFQPPPDAVVGSLKTPDRVALRFARWAPKKAARGTVVVLPGRSEMIERYYEVVAELLERRFAVAIADWRGQGGSARSLRDAAKGHVRSFADYDRDLAAFMDEVVLPDCPPPIFALAHSMGGLICLRALHDGGVRFQRAVLSAPMIAWGPTRPSQGNACRIAAAVTAMGLGSLSAPGQARETADRVPFDGNAFTGDPARFGRNVAIARGLSNVFVGGPTYRWLHAACRAMGQAARPRYAAAIRVPTLMMVGSRERVVSLPAIERFAKNMRLGAALVIPGAQHELLQERDSVRAQFWAAFDAFVPGG
jgi:lysophospholipase